MKIQLLIKTSVIPGSVSLLLQHLVFDQVGNLGNEVCIDLAGGGTVETGVKFEEITLFVEKESSWIGHYVVEHG